MDTNDATLRQQHQLPLIGWALALGATVFAAIAVGLPYFAPPTDPTGAVAPPAEGNLLTILGGVHALTFVNALVLAQLLPPKLRARPNGAASAQIVRWALLEGAALFGIVIVLLAGLERALPAEPIHYANLVSLAWFWVVVWLDTRRLEA